MKLHPARSPRPHWTGSARTVPTTVMNDGDLAWIAGSRGSVGLTVGRTALVMNVQVCRQAVSCAQIRPADLRSCGVLDQPQPKSCSRSSSMPKWWAISCTTVTATSSTSSSLVSHIRHSASRKIMMRSGRTPA